MTQLHGAALAGAVGGEAQHGDLGIDAEDLGGLGGLNGNLGQLLSGRDDHVAVLIQGVLIADVDGAVAHGQLLFPADHDEAGGNQVGAGLGLHQLQGGTDGIGGGVGGAAQQAVDLALLDQHGAEVVALHQRGPALVGAHFALAQGNHGFHHFVHAFIGGGVQNFYILDVKTTLFRGSLDFLHVAHQHGGQEAALDQAGSGLQNTGVSALGKDDFPGILFQGFDHSSEHWNLPPWIRTECP